MSTLVAPRRLQSDRTSSPTPATGRMAPFNMAAIGLALLHGLLAITAVIDKSPTFDEPSHLTSGYSYWLRQDYRLNPENGNLPQRWASLPLLVSRPNFIFENARSWKVASQGETSREFFYRSGNDPDQMLFAGRIMIALMSSALCLLVYFWSRELFGPIAGLLSAGVAAVSPTMLAHGALITSDTMAALFFTASVWAIWRMFARVSMGTVALCAIALSGLALAKMSVLLALPMIAVMAIIRVATGGPLTVELGRSWIVVRRWHQILALSAATGVIALSAFISIWAAFSFRYSALGQDDEYRHRLNARWEQILKRDSIFTKTVSFARDHHLLPEAYLSGLSVVERGSHGRPAFLDNQWSITGFHSFFPKAFLYKTSLPALGLLLLSAVALFFFPGPPPRGATGARWKTISANLYRTAPIWTLVSVYGVFAIATELNIGHRHLLPLYPALFVLCGSCVYLLRIERVSRKFALAAIALLASWQVAESFQIRPHYLAYFNQLAGGPSRGYQHLIDSSVDWGQDLPALKEWLDRNKALTAEREIYLGYFGTADPQWYGIKYRSLLPGTDEAHPLKPLTGGIYCISATWLQQVYAAAMGPWTKTYEGIYRRALEDIRPLQASPPGDDSTPRAISLESETMSQRRIDSFRRLQFARLSAALRQRTPMADAGHSILIFSLSDEEVNAALYGPPAELFEKSQVIGIR